MRVNERSQLKSEVRNREKVAKEKKEAPQSQRRRFAPSPPSAALSYIAFTLKRTCRRGAPLVSIKLACGAAPLALALRNTPHFTGLARLYYGVVIRFARRHGRSYGAWGRIRSTYGNGTRLHRPHAMGKARGQKQRQNKQEAMRQGPKLICVLSFCCFVV